MQPEKIQVELDKVVSALRDFYAREAQLFEKDLGERTFTHRLAVHVEKQFEGWDVDSHPEVTAMVRQLAQTLLADDERFLADARKAVA